MKRHLDSLRSGSSPTDNELEFIIEGERRTLWEVDIAGKMFVKIHQVEVICFSLRVWRRTKTSVIN